MDAHSNPTCHYEILGIPLCRPGLQDSGRAAGSHTLVSPRPPPSVPGAPGFSVNTHAWTEASLPRVSGPADKAASVLGPARYHRELFSQHEPYKNAVLVPQPVS